MTGQVQMTECRFGVELQGGGDHPVQMRRERSGFEVPERCDAPVEARVLARGLGGVLGDVGRHLGGPLVAVSEHLHVDLLAPAGPPSCVGHRDTSEQPLHTRSASCSTPRGGMHPRARPPARWRGGGRRPDAETRPPGRTRGVGTFAASLWLTPSADAELAGEVDHRATPQLGRAGVVQHGAGVVVALGAQRRADELVACDRCRCVQMPGRPWRQRRRAARDGTNPAARTVCTAPKLGAVRVRKTAGCSATATGNALSTLESRAHQMTSVAPVDRGTGGTAHLARRAAGLEKDAVGQTRRSSKLMRRSPAAEATT